jgi:hypothetical protein
MRMGCCDSVRIEQFKKSFAAGRKGNSVYGSMGHKAACGPETFLARADGGKEGLHALAVFQAHGLDPSLVAV